MARVQAPLEAFTGQKKHFLTKGVVVLGQDRRQDLQPNCKQERNTNLLLDKTGRKLGAIFKTIIIVLKMLFKLLDTEGQKNISSKQDFHYCWEHDMPAMK